MSKTEVQFDKILTGGLNLVAPADVMREIDAALLTNLRPDTEGALHSRRGSTVLDNVGERVHTITRVGSRRYLGTAAGNIFRSTGPASITNIGSGFGSEPFGMVSAHGYLWATCHTKTGRYDGSTWFEWNAGKPGAFTAAAGAAGVLNGTFGYYVVFVSVDGEEFEASDRVTVALANQQGSLTGIPVYTAPGGYSSALVNRRRIYRDGGNQSGAFLVGEILDNSTTVFTDNMDEETASARKALEAADNDPPPLCRGLAGPFLGRMLAFSTAGRPNRLFWSKLNQYHAWAGAALDEGNHVDVGEEEDELLAVTYWGRTAILYKQRSIWRLVGDPADAGAEIERVTDAHGLVGARAIASVDGLDYLQVRSGIVVSNGDTLRPVSTKIEPLFLGERPDINPQTFIPLEPLWGNRRKAAIAHRDGYLLYSYPEEGNSENNRTLVYHIARDRWTDDSRGFTALFNEGPDGDFVGCDATNAFLHLNDGRRDKGVTSIPVKYRTGFRNQGLPEHDKVYTDLVIEANTGGQVFTVTCYYNDGAGGGPTGESINTNTRLPVTIPLGPGSLGETARNISVLLEGNAPISGDAAIFSVGVHYRVLPRVAETYDTGELDLGDEHVKRCDYIEIDLEALGTVTWRLYSDRPGAMAQRLTSTFGATTGRDTVRIPLASAADGQLLRLVLQCAQGMRIWKIRFRVLPIGTYIDGANGEKWTTQEVGYGI